MIKDTLYAQYIKERLNREILENDDGFIIYHINGKSCYLADMYVAPGKRKSGSFSKLLHQLSDIALRNGCDVITATIHQFDSNAPRSLSSAFRYGFKMQEAHGNIVTIVLNLTEVLNG